LVPCGWGQSNNYYKDVAGTITYYLGGAGACSFCDLMRLAQNIINFLVYAGVLIAALLFVNAGVLYVMSSASPGNVSKAHRIFINTLIGLIIVLAAWLVIDVVMKTLLNSTTVIGGQQIGPWNNIVCKNAIPSYNTSARPGVTSSGVSGSWAVGASGTWTPPISGVYNTAMITSSAAISQLQSAGVTVSGASLGPNVEQGVIDNIVALNTACGGCVVVTSLSGGSHAAGSGHILGIKADIDDNANTVSYIQSNWTQGSYRGGAYPGYNYIDPSGSGTVCVQEASHFDCCFNQTDGTCT